MNDNDYWVPRHLDAPPLFFVWEADTAIIVIFFLILGAMMNMFLVTAVFAFLIAKGYRYLKEEGGRGLIFRILYWYTPSDWWLSARFPSHRREYFG